MSSDVEARLRRANLLTHDVQLEQLFGEDVSSRLRGHIRALEEDRMTETTSPHGPPTTEGGADRRPDVDIPSPNGSEDRRQPTVRRVVPALGFAVLVLAVGFTALLSMTDGDVVAGGDATPVEIAQAYLDARNDFDVERAKALVSDTFVTSEPPDGHLGAATMDLAFAQHEAYGFHYANVDCAIDQETADDVWVDCDYLWTTAVHTAGDFPPTTETLTFVISDGRIDRIYRGPSGGGDWWGPWVEFLDAEHPEFAGVVERAMLLDEEAHQQMMVQLPHYLDLYEEWAASGQG